MIARGKILHGPGDPRPLLGPKGHAGVQPQGQIHAYMPGHQTEGGVNMRFLRTSVELLGTKKKQDSKHSYIYNRVENSGKPTYLSKSNGFCGAKLYMEAGDYI